MLPINDACTHDTVNTTLKSRLNQTTKKISQKIKKQQGTHNTYTPKNRLKPLENKLTKHVDTKGNYLYTKTLRSKFNIKPMKSYTYMGFNIYFL